MEPSFSVAILLSLFDFRFLFSLFINSSVGFFMELYVVLLCYIEGCQFACWELGAAFCHWDGRDWKWVEAGQPVSLLRCSLGAYPSLSPVACQLLWLWWLVTCLSVCQRAVYLFTQPLLTSSHVPPTLAHKACK